MRRSLEDAAVYLGLREPSRERDDDGGRMVPLTGALLADAGSSLALVAVTTPVVLLVFGWAPASVAGGTAAGAAFWGLIAYWSEVRSKLPRKAVGVAPPNAVVVSSRSGASAAALLRLALFLPLLIAGIWLVDALDMRLPAIFVPGMFAGHGVAALVGALLVARWERSQRRRALIAAGGEAVFHAEPSVGQPSGRAETR